MRNYIILNGQNSKEIEGLLISTLPPITKPKIRTSITEIDGMDGDIVEKLGYSAYDKSFQIGLSYNYDIDDVIAFFNSEGTVIFSNEEDKYYNYQILEQIDFERLERFKTATVRMHVQPFKYSATENAKTIDGSGDDLLNVPSYSNTLNGVTLKASSNIITISGTATTATEFYVPVSALALKAGTYMLSASTNGTYASACSIRLIQSVPSNADSFGGNYLALQNNATTTLNATLISQTTFNYVWFYITAGTSMSFTLDVSVVDMSQSFTIRNSGNYPSKPIITINSNDNVGIYLNNSQIFSIDMTDTTQITINIAEMNAYYADGTFANRIVTGDYDDFVLNVGANTISWDGVVDMITIDNYSRWI